jgi:Uma2 family endonuclease
MAATVKQWTIEEVHSLPDDGNKYELVRGELFVTPPPNYDHETIAARLTRILDPYVESQHLGLLFHPRAVLRLDGSEVEPDLMVRASTSTKNLDWELAPIPILVVEILSPSTRRRDHLQKRSFYVDAGVEEYWLVDPEARTLTAVSKDKPDRIERESYDWRPTGATGSLTVDLGIVFG